MLQTSSESATATQPYVENPALNHNQARKEKECDFPATSRLSRYKSTSELQAKVTTSMSKVTSCSHCRVGTLPQRLQTDSLGKNCSPQSSQNKASSLEKGVYY